MPEQRKIYWTEIRANTVYAVTVGDWYLRIEKDRLSESLRPGWQWSASRNGSSFSGYAKTLRAAKDAATIGVDANFRGEMNDEICNTG